VRLAIANQHGTVVDADDARVGDRDFEDVGSEVFEASFAGGDRLAVDVPGDLPDIVGNLIQQFCLLHQIAELGTKDDREGFDRQEEIDSGGMPGAIGRADGTAGNDVVNVGMILKSATPGVQHTEEAREVGAHVLWIEGECFDGLGGRLEQSRVTDSLILPYERA